MRGPPNCTLFVAGISKQTNAEDLGKYFENWGRLVRCDITRGRESQNPISFVEFIDIDDAERAWRAVNRASFQGRNLIVEYATGTPSSSWDSLNSHYSISDRPSHPSSFSSSSNRRDNRGRGRGRSRSRSRSVSPYYSQTSRNYSHRYHERSSYRSRSRSRSPSARRDRARTPDYSRYNSDRRGRSRSPPSLYDRERRRFKDSSREGNSQRDIEWESHVQSHTGTQVTGLGARRGGGYDFATISAKIEQQDEIGGK